MQKYHWEILHSASDICNFLECEHIAYLDLIDLNTPLQRTEDDEAAKLVQARGHAHEAAYAQELQSSGLTFINIADGGGNLDRKVEATLQAMRDGVDVIYQASLRNRNFVGHADFLRKVAIPSKLGNYSYEAADTKLARSTKAKFLIQLAFYSALIAEAQGTDPVMMHVVLGDKNQKSYRYADFRHYFMMLRDRYLQRVSRNDVETYPHLCEKCDQCKWRGNCENRRFEEDHLSQVANISRLQIKKLEDHGIKTLAALAQLPEHGRVPKISQQTLGRLRHQASLQLKARETGRRYVDKLPLVAGELRGFARLPRPDAGDMFFDMEGNPLEEGGLEYLFGLYFFDYGEEQFKGFWAHDRAQEKVAFEDFMDFVTARLRQFPNAHIYHYATYEQTALKKLMSLHGTREAEVDNLLRRSKLVDLYKVVREGIRVSEPRYSIKNIEHFYMEAREGDVQNAGASIVFYEQWKETQDPKLLQDIESYNFDDVRSTYLLREWLLTLRPADLAWANGADSQSDSESQDNTGELTEAERRLIPYRQALIDPLPAKREIWGSQEYMQELTYQLLDFHRRADKPAWWAMFARMDMTLEELLEDGESLAGLTLDPDNPPVSVKRSIQYTYLYPEQESKIKTGDNCVIIASGARLSNLVVDPDTRRVTFTRGASQEPPPPRIDIGLGGPIESKSLVNALFRFADSVARHDGKYPAIRALLNHELPRVRGITPGRPIIDNNYELLPQAVSAIAHLDESWIFVQGPPGAGKTYTGSHVIVDLIRQGFRVGISSNSHKAINNLLAAIEDVARKQDVNFYGVKKSSPKDDSRFNGDLIRDVFENDAVAAALHGGAQLVAGTAWLFADEKFDQALDFLFVDEAGQVALANLVAMGTSAKNIVLLGDQMQLGQPIQGVHPGRSGESTLEYLLNGLSTIPPERGIFLGTTYRMHPVICQFISEAVYDGRLDAVDDNFHQMVLLKEGSYPALKPFGVHYLPIEHDACGQRSHEEAALAKELFLSLLGQEYMDKARKVHPMTMDDILVISPYNMQVNLLKQVLPEGARVGTVDKFQGQEAEVVIISMATSNGDYLPRNIEFLYSKNRLNVAISRAKCLALFIANPALMSIRCSTPEEMALVNTLCWVKSYE